MREALRLAREGMEGGDGGPFGAVIVRQGEIIGRGWNRVLSAKDPTAHAEICAIRDACARVGDYWLPGATLYTSCEPCPMCLAAAYWARIDRVVYAASREDAAAIGFADESLYQELARPWSGRNLSATQVLQAEAVGLMQGWPELAPERGY